MGSLRCIDGTETSSEGEEMTVHNFSDVITGVISSASVLYRILPSPNNFDKYPRFQSIYGLFYLFLSGAALNKSKKNGGNV